VPDGWYLVPAASFMPHQIAWPIPGSSQAVLLPIHQYDGKQKALALSDLQDNQLDISELKKEAENNAATILEGLSLEYVRDENDVILYAVLAGESPVSASAVTAPGFLKKFHDTIGPDAVVVIPNRYRIYVFPRSAPPTSEFPELIFIDYRSSLHPVSREFFDIVPGGLRAAGVIR